MNVRVTSLTQTNNAIGYIQLRNADLSKYQDQVSSGLRVTKPSDDPAAFPEISQAKTASARLDAYSQNISSATSTLNAGVSTLQDVNDLLVQARQIAQQGADAATNGDQSQRDALATQVDGLIDRALRDANAQPDGKSIFGGTATNTPPFSVATTDAQGRPATIAYNGATQRTRVLTGPGQTVDTRYVGSSVFQQPGADVFQSLIGLRDDLRNTNLTGPALNTSLNQRLGTVDAARTAIGDATGEQSSNLATLQSLSSLNSDTQTATENRLGDLQDTDYATAVVKMKEQQTALQAIYATTVQMLQPGLLNFIQPSTA
jgi:flagellin-like hook-associated protein FlgL